MKTKVKIFTVMLCAVICLLSFTACADGGLAGKSTLLGKPATAKSVEYEELEAEDFNVFKKSVEEFAAGFAAYAYLGYEKQDNFAVSPISVYMALALAAECAGGDTRSEILGGLGVSYQQLKTHFSTLYRSLAREKKVDNKTTSLLSLGNSVWVNEGTNVKKACINSLSNDYYAYSYSADFANDNVQANKAVRDFAKKRTNGIIDQDFKISEETLFTLINTLYLKSVWNTNGKDLPFAEDRYDFTAKNGTVKNVQLLEGYYNGGRIQEFETFTAFYTATKDSYRIKFLLPKDGYTIDSVFTAANVAAVNAVTDYGFLNEDETVRYLTRVLFPEYKCGYDGDIVGILEDNFNIDLSSQACDFSTITNDTVYCDKIQHVTDLTVNRKGIEGAAVTVAPAPGAAGPMETVYSDFIVNKAFGFIITDSRDTTLFSGVVNNV